jgi:hypothetical protein
MLLIHRLFRTATRFTGIDILCGILYKYSGNLFIISISVFCFIHNVNIPAFVLVLELDQSGIPVDTETNTSIPVDNDHPELKLYGRPFLIILFVAVEFL